MKHIRIGSGAGYAGDRLEPALELIKYGKLDYIGFECLAERTIAIAQQEKSKDSTKGYNNLLEYRMEKVIPLAHEHKVKVITNMGAANPISAADKCIEIARKNNIYGLKIAAVLGDDVYDKLSSYNDTEVWETGKPLSELDANLISANAYLGAEGIVRALEEGADIVITGRCSDPALFISPLIYEFGWDMNDWDKLGKGTLVGHLLECGSQVCGGYYAEPGKKDVENLDILGFPIIDFSENGVFTVSKLENQGGVINAHTCTEQMIYEIHNPEMYFTPDVVADFSKVEFKEIGKNIVEVTGATGKEKTATLKTSMGYVDCYIGEAQISYGGKGCLERAKLAAEIVEKRIAIRKLEINELKIDLIGVNSLYWGEKKSDSSCLNEVRLRVVGRSKDRANAQKLTQEVETLYTNGPAGGSGVTQSVREIVSIASILVDRNDIDLEVVVKEA